MATEAASAVRQILRLAAHVLVLRPLLHVAFGLNVRGRHHLPRAGPFVIAANHNSHLDILVLCAALPVRLLAGVHVVAASDYFARPRWLFALVTFLFRPVWVDRQDRSCGVVEAMSDILDRGDSVIIFPEGTRGEAGQLGHFHSGVGRLVAGRTGLTLLPTYLRGSERALPRGAPLPVPIWQHVTIGPPQVVSGDALDITADLRATIVALARSHSASRHLRRAERPRSLVVAVLGVDGSGKSTLSRHLALSLSAGRRSCLLSDRLEVFDDGRPWAVQPLLKDTVRRLVSAQAKSARSLARYKVPKLAELLLRDALLGEARRWYGPHLVVMDGSPLMNITAWSVLYRGGLVSPDFCARAMTILAGGGSRRDPLYRQHPELRVLSRLGLTRLAVPDVVILVDVDATVAVARIASRGEARQVHETTDHLARLGQAYQAVVEAASRHLGLAAFVVDGRRDLESVQDEAVRLVTSRLETVHQAPVEDP